jgi:hypothetical protein
VGQPRSDSNLRGATLAGAMKHKEKRAIEIGVRYLGPGRVKELMQLYVGTTYIPQMMLEVQVVINQELIRRRNGQ